MRWAIWCNPLTECVHNGGRRRETIHRKVAGDDRRVELERPPIGTDVEGGETDGCRYDQQANYEAAGTRVAHFGPAYGQSR
jgi:hypothetical protein